MDTDSFYLVLAHDILYYCICPSKNAEWEALRETDSDYFLTSEGVQNFSQELVVINIKSTISANQDYSGKKLDVLKCFVFVAKPMVTAIQNRISTNLLAIV